MPHPVVQFEGVDVVYALQGGGETIACSGLSFSVFESEFVSIVGPSGCGKSTSLRVIAGLQPASRGSARVRGELLQSRVPDGLSMMFQSPVLLDWESVIDNVGLPLEVAGAARSKARERARHYLALAKLERFEKARPFELSGGMQQRVALCRALVSRPDLLLMDEPFGALDALTRAQMGGMLQEIWAKQQVAVVFVTHSIREAVTLSDRVLVMSARPGRMLRDIAIDLPRPREGAVRRLARFQDYVDAIASCLGMPEGAE
jgi:NitT/TauT family transport system ATP-binding protein